MAGIRVVQISITDLVLSAPSHYCKVSVPPLVSPTRIGVLSGKTQSSPHTLGTYIPEGLSYSPVPIHKALLKVTYTLTFAIKLDAITETGKRCRLELSFFLSRK